MNSFTVRDLLLIPEIFEPLSRQLAATPTARGRVDVEVTLANGNVLQVVVDLDASVGTWAEPPTDHPGGAV